MWYVYIIKSTRSNFRYIGSTNDLDRRLVEHNDGLSPSTKAYKTFELEAFVALKSEHKARNLKKYFKTGSGKVILKKRILTDEALAYSVLLSPLNFAHHAGTPVWGLQITQSDC